MKRISIIFIFFLNSCDDRPIKNEYIKPSKEQKECLTEYRKLSSQSLKEELELFKKSLYFKDDDSIINYELYQRREVERLCMIKADCYDKLKGVEFSNCINDAVEEY